MAKLPADKINSAPPEGRSFFDPPADLLTLSRWRGVRPLDFNELMTSEEVWPADEDVDDFIAAARGRHGESNSNLTSN